MDHDEASRRPLSGDECKELIDRSSPLPRLTRRGPGDWVFVFRPGPGTYAQIAGSFRSIVHTAPKVIVLCWKHRRDLGDG